MNIRNLLSAVTAAMLLTHGSGNAAQPSYDEASKTLTLPVLQYNGEFYYGIELKLKQFDLSKAPTGSGKCDPKNREELAAQPDFSCFSDQAAFDQALAGTWSDAQGRTLTFSDSGPYGTAKFPSYTVLAGSNSTTYRNCELVFDGNGATADTGYYPQQVTSIRCNEGTVPLLNGTSPAIADQLFLNAFGGQNRIDRLVVSNLRAGGFSNVVFTRAK